MDFGSGGSKDTYSNRDYCVANYYLARAYKRKGDKQNALKHVNIGYKLFGVGMDNISHNLNDLETAIKKMP